MKSSLVLDIISTHFDGTDEDFIRAVERLAMDEDRKGNSVLALEIRKAVGGVRSSYRDKPSTVAGIQSEGPAQAGDDGLVTAVYPDASFEDMVLDDDLSEGLMEIVSEWRNRDRLPRGMRPTNRILMTGPPGCGKTMAANALAHTLGMRMAYVRLDGLISQYMGQTGSNLREVFNSVRDGGALLFIDEFDAVGKTRADPADMGESKRILTVLLQNMDMMDDRVLLVAATNMPDLLDPAVLRRFDVTLRFGLPDRYGRERLISILASRYGLSNSYDPDTFTAYTEGMSYAEVETVFESVVRYVAINDVRGPLDEAFLRSFLAHKGRARDIREMRNAGLTLQQISDATGIPRSTVYYRLRRE